MCTKVFGFNRKGICTNHKCYKKLSNAEHLVNNHKRSEKFNLERLKAIGGPKHFFFEVDLIL